MQPQLSSATNNPPLLPSDLLSHSLAKKKLCKKKVHAALHCFFFITLRLGIGAAYGETFKFIGHEENSNGNDYSAMRYGVRGMQW